MATYDLTHGGVPRTWGNVGYAMFPSKEVGPYEFMQPAAHFRPNTFIVNRYLWFGGSTYYTTLDAEAKQSPALAHWLRNLRADGADVTTADKLKVITLPIDTVFKTLYFRNLKASAGYTVNISVIDKAGATVHDFGAFSLASPHLDLGADGKTYTEHTVFPLAMPSNAAVAQAARQAAYDAAVANGGSTPTTGQQSAIDAALAALNTAKAAAEAAAPGYYMGHNHELVVQFTAIPDGKGIDDTQFIVAAEMSAPWHGAW